MSEKTKASWADEIDELDQETESTPVTYEKEITNKGEEDDRVESGEDRPRRRERNNRNRDREPREPREQREPLPFPDSPPFTAFVGNLPYNVYRDEIQKFFEDRGCKVQNVRLVTDKESNRPKGYGYVTFDELTDLKNAVSLTGQSLLDRPLRIDVAEAKADDFVKPKREYNNSNNRNSRGGGRYSSDRRDRDRERERGDNEGGVRPRIELLPRSTSSSEDVSDAYKAKENPFGSAKPRDEQSALKQIEERRSKEDISPVEDRDKSNTSRDRPPRRDNNNKSFNYDRPPRGDKSAPRGGRKFDDKKRDSRSNRDDKPRAPRPLEVKSEPVIF